MVKTNSKSRSAFAAALVLSFVTSFLPAGWLGWTNWLHDLVMIPLAPFGEAGVWVRAQMSSKPRSVVIGDDVEAHIRLLEQEADHWRSLHAARVLEIDQLRLKLQALEQVGREAASDQVRVLTSDIISQPIDRTSGIVELDAGARLGVVGGAVGVGGGADLLGRVTRVSALKSTFQATTNKATGAIQAVVAARRGEGAGLDGRDAILATPTGDGSFEADIDRTLDVAEGDLVYVSDPAWPRCAQGLVLGEVVSKRTKEEQPLRDRIVIRPRRDLLQVSFVVLKWDAPGAGGGAGNGGGGG